MIIKSILDSDLYKFTQGQLAWLLFPLLVVKYRFIDRSNRIYPPGFADKLISEIKLMSSLHLEQDEKDFLLTKHPELTSEYVNFLSKFRYDPSEVDVHQDEEGHLYITITGKWCNTILWEVSLMSIISELFFIETKQIVDLTDDKLVANDLAKIRLFEDNGVEFIDMGSRRRYSLENQLRVTKLFKERSNTAFKGTSNVLVAKELGIKCFGSLAHEFVMVMAAIYGVENANKKAMDTWKSVYPSSNIYLPDTLTTDVFLKSYNGDYLDSVSILRQDSGSPYEFADKLVKHYKDNGINPMDKYLMFSDSLNVEKAISIKEYCDGKINVLPFGIGTFITSDVGVKPLNIVIKISHVFVDGEWRNAVKLSDDKGKSTGNIDTVNEYKHILNIK